MQYYETVIVDIDGCIALPPVGRTIPYLDPAHHKQCEALMLANPASSPLIALIQILHKAGKKIVLMTARPERFRACTIEWHNHYKVPYWALLMRPECDGHLSDAALKLRMYKTLIGIGHRVLFVIEDRKPVVQMWREQGLLCLQPRDCD